MPLSDKDKIFFEAIDFLIKRVNDSVGPLITFASTQFYRFGSWIHSLNLNIVNNFYINLENL